jgi:multimeric flavodoxin WrbA/nitrite reductase/ring-hydroxylating ferredoxin subunit
MAQDWHDLGPSEPFKRAPLTEVAIGRLKLAVSFVDGRFGAIHGSCNHAGGPLGQGTLEDDYVTCPWHYWKFHRLTGEGEPGFEADRVPRFAIEERDGHLFIDPEPQSTRNRLPHDPHPLARAVERAAGPVRVVGISTTGMDVEHPRVSTSEELLNAALAHAETELGAETRLIRLAALKFRACEGFYSKSAHACTWPCSITQMYPKDEMTEVYEALVHWADVVLVATPIRWGSASSLYFRMAERLNCVQNQITIRNRVLIRNKVAGFIVTGGQDNIQGVVGQLMTFFSELGFSFPQFPFIAHSRGWTAEDMENNVAEVLGSEELHDGARDLTARSMALAQQLLAGAGTPAEMRRGGRKAHRLEVERRSRETAGT